LTRFVLVRHGQTEWNRVERFRGRADLDLDEVGVRQGEASAERIARWQTSALYSSPLRRAMRTAEIISRRLNLPVTPLDGLIDIDYGTWQGLSQEEVSGRDGDRYKLWLESPDKVEFPDGESLEDVRGRVVGVIEELSSRHDDQTIILVSHKVVCKVVLLYLLGLDNSRFWHVEQDVGAINAFEVIEGISRVSLLNDTCHLRGLATTRSIT